MYSCSDLAPLERGIETIEYLLTQDYRLSPQDSSYPISKRSVALLLLQRDPVFSLEAQQKEPLYYQIEQVIQSTQAHFDVPLIFVISQTRYLLGV